METKNLTENEIKNNENTSTDVVPLPTGGIIKIGANEINLKIYFSGNTGSGPQDGPAVGVVANQDPPKAASITQQNVNQTSAKSVVGPQDGPGIGVVGNQDPPKDTKNILNISVYF